MPQKLTLILFFSLILTVIIRALILKYKGIKAFVFAKTHKSDWLLPPCVIFFIYHLIAYTFDLPCIRMPLFIHWNGLAWFGLISCLCGWLLFLWGVVSFGISFRVGIDDNQPGELVTKGAFRITRNPLYVAFGLELIGFFFTYPNLLFLIALILGSFVLSRQILREENFLKTFYQESFEEYCKEVPRYLW